MELYHVTPAVNLPYIMKQGLVPKLGGTFADVDPYFDYGKRVFLTEDPEDVLDFARKFAADWAVIKVQLPPGAKLHSDPGSPGKAHYFVKKRIPPRFLQAVEIIDRGYNKEKDEDLIS